MKKNWVWFDWFEICVKNATAKKRHSTWFQLNFFFVTFFTSIVMTLASNVALNIIKDDYDRLLLKTWWWWQWNNGEHLANMKVTYPKMWKRSIQFITFFNGFWFMVTTMPLFNVCHRFLGHGTATTTPTPTIR